MKEEIISDCKRQIEFFDNKIAEFTKMRDDMKFILSALESFNT